MSDWSTVVSQFHNIVYQAGLIVKSDPDNRIKARGQSREAIKTDPNIGIELHPSHFNAVCGDS